MSTITGTHNSGILLNNYTNPMTIASGAIITGSSSHYFGNAVYGKTTPWTVVNDGTIRGATTPIAGAGIDLADGGTVTNNGLITGLEGVDLDGIGSVSNEGTIQGSGGAFGVILFGDGDTLTNGGSTIRLATTIAGTITGGFEGVSGFFTSTVTNIAGMIAGGTTGVELEGAGSVVTNFASISGGGGAGVELTAGGAVSNESRGLLGLAFGIITGPTGIEISGGAGTVSNVGEIEGSSGYGVYLEAGGNVTNSSSTSFLSSTPGLISGGATGVRISGGSGTVVNSAEITGTSGDGINLIGGSVTNFGAIESGGVGSADGIYIFAGAGSAAVTNAASGAAVGLIKGYADGISIVGGSGSVTNSGTIRSTGATANGIYLEGGPGGVTSTAGYIYGPASGVELRNGGVVTNSATIVGGQYGIDLFLGGSVYSNITAARIVGGVDGITSPGAAAAVTNSGTVQGSGNYGINLLEGGSVTNGQAGAATGTVFGYGGVYIGGGFGFVANYGTIQGTGDAGVVLSAGGIISNGAQGAGTGLIEGRAAGISLAGSVAATIINYGTITGAVGVQVAAADTAANSVTNAGTITGTGGTAVKLAAGNDVLTVDPGAAFLGASGNPGTVDGGGGSNTIELAGTAPAIFSGLGTQFIDFATVTIDAGADWQVDVTPTTLVGETISGAGGADVLALTHRGTFNLAEVSGFPTIKVADGGSNTLTFTDSNFTNVAGKIITFDGGSGGNTVAAGLAAGLGLVLNGGSGNDVFKLSEATLATSQVRGGAGKDKLDLTNSGTIVVSRVTGVETIDLSSLGANTLTLTNWNFTAVTGNTITVDGGNRGDTIGETAGVVATDAVILEGGTGADTLIAGQHAIMTGAAGADVFEFETPGTTATPDKNTIKDFASGTPVTDKIAFSNKGFSLRLPDASTTPTPLPSSLFSSKTNGMFDNANERFAYDTANGGLFYDAHGNTAGSSRELVATLTGHPTLAATDLFYVS